MHLIFYFGICSCTIWTFDVAVWNVHRNKLTFPFAQSWTPPAISSFSAVPSGLVATKEGDQRRHFGLQFLLLLLRHLPRGLLKRYQERNHLKTAARSKGAEAAKHTRGNIGEDEATAATKSGKTRKKSCSKSRKKATASKSKEETATQEEKETGLWLVGDGGSVVAARMSPWRDHIPYTDDELLIVMNPNPLYPKLLAQTECYLGLLPNIGTPFPLQMQTVAHCNPSLICFEENII